MDGGAMIWTTRTIGLLVTMALLTGGAAWGVHSFLTPAEGAGADSGLDTNGNGKFDWLVVEADVTLPAAGQWDVYADLSSPHPLPAGPCGIGVPVPVMRTNMAYGPIAWTYEHYFFPAGSQTVRMAFAGTDIARAGVDGPYSVHARLSLGGFPQPAILAPEPYPSGDVVEWNYTTRAYAVGDFEMPTRPAFFTGSHMDSPVDVDSDGLADFLELTADVHVNTAGHYNLFGSVSKGSGTDVVRMVAYAYRDFDLTTGDTKVFLRFRGDQIHQAGVDGPWDFSLTLYGILDLPYAGGIEPPIGSFRPTPAPYPETLCGSTAAYRTADFDETVELLRYTARFEESTPDRDADSKYDALVVRAEVEVFVGAGFDAEGVLRPVGGTADVARAASQVWLRDGLQWVEFGFPGSEINASRLDGPYEATLSLTPAQRGIDPKTTYVTRAYRAADFDADSIGGRGYWIGNLSVAPVGNRLSIAGEVVRGNDMLAVVFEDILTVTITNSTGSVVGSFQTKVVLANSGSGQSFSFSTDVLPGGTYTITAVLGPADRPVDSRTVVVTL